MNRFEKQVYECMLPTARLLEQTTKPLHRAILLNFWRHVHLEGAGQYEQILKADMVVVKRKLKKAEKASANAWQALKDDTEKGVDGLKSAYQKVAEKFQ